MSIAPRGHPLPTTLRKLAPTQVQLDIEVSSSDLDQARIRALRKLGQQLRIPGFRPGHIPQRIVEQHVGAEHVDHEAIEAVVPDAYAKALEEHDLDPVDHPKIDLERTQEGRALKITATVAVKPEIKLGTYTGISVTKHRPPVNDEDVDKSIEALRRRAATLEPVSRGIESGDIVTLDYEGRIDGELFEGGTATNHTTEVSPDRFIPGFAEQLYGASAGDHRTVKVTFPPTYRPDALAGKPATFEVAIHAIKTPVPPPLDDAFAKLVSDLETLDALRAEVRRRLERGADQQAREQMEGDVLRALIAAHDFPLPDVLVERESAALLADLKRSVAESGVDWNAFLQARKATEEELGAQVRIDAQRRVKGALLLEAIAKAENIRVSAADVEGEVDRLAHSTGRSRQTTLQALERQEGVGRLLSAIKRNKTLALLVEKAKVVEAPEAEAPAPTISTT
jgi:trigger factor